MSQATFKRNAHAKYFNLVLQLLPAKAQEHDSNRVTIAFFGLAGLTLLGQLSPSDKDRQGWIEWLWSLQAPTGGFRGSPGEPSTTGHLPSTYTALACLGLLRAPLDRLDRGALADFVRACQCSDGSFSPTPDTQGRFQNDARMAYCALVVCSVAAEGDSAAIGKMIDVEATRRFLAGSQTWEGGFASNPGMIEAHAGMSYCALAGLTLLNATDSINVEAVARWLIQRQIGGFQGRPGKLEDVCYSFWAGGALAAISRAHLVNASTNTAFLLNAQSPVGGFGKEPGDFPDPFHSYLALAALSLMSAREELGLREIDPVWNLDAGAKGWLVGGWRDKGQPDEA